MLKKIITLVLTLYIVSPLSALSVTDVIIAIEKVESNQNPYALNVKENALGCLQIRPIMMEDYNRITGENLPHSAARYRSVAYIVATEVFHHYMKGIEKPTAKHLAFIWNGGGSAWRYVDDPNYGNYVKRRRLEIYWHKVKSHLD